MEIKLNIDILIDQASYIRMWKENPQHQTFIF